MRTAKQIFNGYKRMIDAEGSAYWVTEKDFITAINEARSEALIEAVMLYVQDGSPETFRDKILNLINSIK